jgi:hypothetical protein
MRAAKRRRGRPRLRERRARGLSGESSLYRRSRMPRGRDRGPRNARPACRRHDLSAALVSCVAGGNANRCARIRARGFSPMRRPDDHIHAAGRRTKVSPIAFLFALPHGTLQVAICNNAAKSPSLSTIFQTRCVRPDAIAPPAAVRDRPDDRCVRRAPRRPPGRTARREIDLGLRGQPGR